MNTGINAEAKLVALANPRWIRILNKEINAIVATIGIPFKPNNPNVASLNHCAACVCSNTFPNEIPTPKTIIVPQGMRCSASFQLITPIFGVNITAKANSVIDDESIGCNTFSVDHKTNNNTEIMIKRHSLGFTGPSSASCCLTSSVPPSISFFLVVRL